MNDRFEQAPRTIVFKIMAIDCGFQVTGGISVKWDWNWEVDEIYVFVLDALEEKTK